MSIMLRRRLMGRLAAVLLAVAMVMVGSVVKPQPAQAQALLPCSGGYVRLHRATAPNVWDGRGGTVDTSAGSWIGTDYYTGGTVSVDRTSWNWIAAAGNNLYPRSEVVFFFREVPFTTTVTNSAYVSYNGVLRDDNYNYTSNRVPVYGNPRFLYPGRWEVSVVFMDKTCGWQPRTYIGFLNVAL